MTITADCGSYQAGPTLFEPNITYPYVKNDGSMFRLSAFAFGSAEPRGSGAAGYFLTLLPTKTALYGSNAKMGVLTLDTEGILLPEEKYR